MAALSPLRRAGLAALLALATAPALSALASTDPWDLGQAQARMVGAGYSQEPRTGHWSAQVVLRLVNRDPRRNFHQQVVVEFVGPTGIAWRWKTFVSLDPGEAQHRRVSTPPRLDCSGPLQGCPQLQVRVGLKAGDLAQGLVAVPLQALDDKGAPPEGQPLYVARVLEPGVLELLGGQKVHVMGVAVGGRKRGSDDGSRGFSWTWQQVMDGPVRLAYDGERRDGAGRWVAHVSLPDGRDLGAELLTRGLARFDRGSSGSRAQQYLVLETAARSQKTGVWKP